MKRMTDADHDKVSAAITKAELSTAGEIVAVATPISDSYHDVALHWALVPLFAVLAWAAWRPSALEWWYDFLLGGWQPEPTQSQLLTLLMVFAALKFTVALLILKWMPLRLLLTPAATKHRRVRRRAVMVFKTAAERRTEGRTGILIYLSMAERRAEIVAVATPISDSYHDVALHWALVPLFAVLAWAAWCPGCLTWCYNLLFGGWQPDPTLGQLLTLLMFFAALKFTVALLLLKWMPLRLALTPASTKHRRVRRRAVMVFKTAAERRTEGRTGILIYLSMAERRAEIVADEAILAVTDDHTWGEAMAALIAEVRQGRPGDGICAAIERVGVVLSEHFPRSDTDTNEIPDKLIEL